MKIESTVIKWFEDNSTLNEVRQLEEPKFAVEQTRYRRDVTLEKVMYNWREKKQL